MPEPTHWALPVNGKSPWITLRQALKGLNDARPRYNKLSPAKKKYLRLVPEGGNWRYLPKRMQAKALGGAYKSWGGRAGFFRRLAWGKPAPALTSRPDSKATMMCHPTKLRPPSIRECARLQQFPDWWGFAGGLPQQYLQLGNAVPVGLGEAVGKAIRKAMRQQARTSLKGKARCSQQDLLERLAQRPRTVLNPVRMRKIKTVEAAKEWLNGKNRARLNILHSLDQDEQKQRDDRCKKKRSRRSRRSK
jgi:DNA (cytosine-5)-methyltransferase 1